MVPLSSFFGLLVVIYKLSKLIFRFLKTSSRTEVLNKGVLLNWMNADYIQHSFGERKFSLGLDHCIIGGKKTLSKFLIKKIITFRIVDMGFSNRKGNHIAFPVIQIWDSLAFSVSLCIWIMITLAFQHLSSFFLLLHRCEVPAMHDLISSIINITLTGEWINSISNTHCSRSR